MCFVLYEKKEKKNIQHFYDARRSAYWYWASGAVPVWTVGLGRDLCAAAAHPPYVHTSTTTLHCQRKLRGSQ
jgi:hypothetical protein